MPQLTITIPNVSQAALADLIISRGNRTNVEYLRDFLRAEVRSVRMQRFLDQQALDAIALSAQVDSEIG